MRVEELLLHKGTRIISVSTRVLGSSSVRMGETVETATRMLRRENIGAVVVKDVCGTEGDTIMGMLSERDVVRALVDHGPAVLKKPVSHLMSTNVICCRPTDDLADAIALFDRHQIRHLPVIDGTALIGVISTRDIIAITAAEAARTAA